MAYPDPYTALARTSAEHTFTKAAFKSFPVQDDEHFLTVCRYVERNPLKANLVNRAEEWQWSSLHRWLYGKEQERSLLSRWPISRKRSWLEHVNEVLSESEFNALQRSLQRGCPYGDSNWSQRKIRQLGLETTIRPRGRPKKGS